MKQAKPPNFALALSLVLTPAVYTRNKRTVRKKRINYRCVAMVYMDLVSNTNIRYHFVNQPLLKIKEEENL